jgi:hypothetical protein
MKRNCVADSRLVSGTYRKAFDDTKTKDEFKKVIQRVEVSLLSFLFLRISPKLKVDDHVFLWLKLDNMA